MTTQTVAVATAPTPRRTSAQFRGKQGIALAVIVVSVASFAFTIYQPGPEIDLTPHQALGDMAAAETLKLLRPGGRVILIDRELKMFKSPATLTHLKSFERALRKAGPAVSATNVIKVDPLRPLNVPPSEFFELLRRTTEADVVVSFLGPPALSSEQVSRLESKHAQVIAFCPGNIPQQSNLPGLLQSGLVRLAIVERQTSTAPLADPVSPPSGSEHRYVVVTSSNLSPLSVKEGRSL